MERADLSTTSDDDFLSFLLYASVRRTDWEERLNSSITGIVVDVDPDRKTFRIHPVIGEANGRYAFKFDKVSNTMWAVEDNAQNLILL